MRMRQLTQLYLQVMVSRYKVGVMEFRCVSWGFLGPDSRGAQSGVTGITATSDDLVTTSSSEAAPPVSLFQVDGRKTCRETCMKTRSKFRLLGSRLDDEKTSTRGSVIWYDDGRQNAGTQKAQSGHKAELNTAHSRPCLLRCYGISLGFKEQR